VDELEEIKRRKREKLAAKLMVQNEADEMVSGEKGKPVDITDDSFQDFIKKNPVAVIDCWAPWCGPCRMVAPVIEELAAELSGKVAFGKLNTDDNPQTAMKYQIMSIPTLLFFVNEKHVDTLIGARPRESILKQLQPLIE
jgi:thioredoxin 1